MREAERVEAALRQLLILGGLSGQVRFSGADPVLPVKLRLGAAGAASLGAIGVAANALWSLRHAPQEISVDLAEAVASLRAYKYTLLDGKPAPYDHEALSGFYPTGDGRHVFLHCNFPHLKAANVRALGAEPTRESVAAAVLRGSGEAMETAIHENGGVASFVRTPEEWANHPHAAAVASLPVLEIERIGDAPPQQLPGGERPLSGVRALDLTRVIAGPVACRTLAEHGADVLKISRPDLPGAGTLDIDTGIGKRSTFLDMRDAAQNARMQQLVRDADVFIQSYRPGTLARRGYGWEDLAALRPGLVMCTLSAWGRVGPWQHRRGYDTIVQAATGLAFENGTPGAPAMTPVAAIDYISGNLMAYGVMLALHRRATVGGSWLVRCSLAGIGHWMRSLGAVNPAGATADGPDKAAAAMRVVELPGPLGHVSCLRSPLMMSATPPRPTLPPVPLGTHAAEWLPR